MVYALQNSKAKNLAILWSHNEEKHPFWLNAIIRVGGNVWWDVGWKIIPQQFSYPLTGYVWNTIEKAATHRATILEINTDPSSKTTAEVIKSWTDANIHYNPNSPILAHQKDRNVPCTLLKLSQLRRLTQPGDLDDFILAKQQRPIAQVPQGAAIVEDPNLT